MPRGTITQLVPDPGLGFITPDDGGPRALFHHTAVVGARFDQLREGQRVEYDSRVGPFRHQVRAFNVRLIETAPTPRSRQDGPGATRGARADGRALRRRH